MRRLLLIVAVAASVVGAARGSADPSGAVVITAPSEHQPVFGKVEVEVEIHSEVAVEHLEIVVDGRLGASLARPPWRAQVDVGQDNREHRFRAVAVLASGQRLSGFLVTPRVEVDAEYDVSLQELFVTVTRNSHRVLDLDASDFRVIDDGRDQEIVTFARGDVPLTAAVLVDSSESMEGEPLAAALRGVRSFAVGMKELDEAMLLLFSDRLLLSTPFTTDPSSLMGSLDDVRAGGGTAVNDHLYLALKLLDARPGRKVVILLSDGADVHSVLRMKEVYWKARRSQAMVYWILLQEGEEVASYSSAWRDFEGNREEYEGLEEAVEESGGRIIRIARIDQLQRAFQEVLRELREQYVLGYYPTDRTHNGRWREVDVRVRGLGNRVRTRGGYVDF